MINTTQASFILDKVKRASPYVDSMSYWTFTDIFEENGPRFTPFHGGFGLMNLQGIRKPAYFAYRFLHQLGTEDIACDDPESWVTRSENGSVQALIWDYTSVVPPAPETDQTFYKKEQPSVTKGTLRVQLDHVQNGKYRVAIYLVGYEKNDVYTAYLRMGSPDQLTRAQVSALNAASKGAPDIVEDVVVDRGMFLRDLPLRTNDVYLIVLTPSVRND